MVVLAVVPVVPAMVVAMETETETETETKTKTEIVEVLALK
jgi:hypothetical protein